LWNPKLKNRKCPPIGLFLDSREFTPLAPSQTQLQPTAQFGFATVAAVYAWFGGNGKLFLFAASGIESPNARP
jgi:hypothetical protein